MDLVVAAGGGERDEAVDAIILEASASRNDREVLLNEKLTTDLRPTLFLAQLSNLLAGNISIVHKVTGSSRTFMGEEGAGVAAIETAAARIRSGQSDHVLVGGAFQTEHSDMLLGYELGGFLHRGPWKPVWQRGASDGGGVVSGSGGCFLVLESRQHAKARGRAPYARIDAIASDRVRRSKIELKDGISDLLARVGAPKGALLGNIGSVRRPRGNGGGEGRARAAFRHRHPRFRLAHWPYEGSAVSVRRGARGAGRVEKGEAYPAFDRVEAERPFDGAPDQVLATAIGYHRLRGCGVDRPRRSEGFWNHASHHQTRPSRQAARRRHRHRHGDVARRRQVRQLGCADRRTLRHPQNHPLSGRSSQHPDQRHGRFPVVVGQGRQPADFRAGRYRRHRSHRRSRPQHGRFWRAAIPGVAARRARLAGPHVALS